MSAELPTPPVPDLARTKGRTVAEMSDWFIDFFNQEGAPFNYRRGTRAVRAAYRGVHRLHLLTAGCVAEKTAIGRMANREIVTLAAPYAFGRKTQVFDLARRRFPFGHNRSAAYRIPFFFVEGGVVKLYYLQPRKGEGPDFNEICMIGTIYKKFLLETEFYGQRTDLEIVDLGAIEKGGPRVTKTYSLAELTLWSDEQLTDRLTLIAEALDSLGSSDRIVRRRRPRPTPEPEMPLFD